LNIFPPKMAVTRPLLHRFRAVVATQHMCYSNSHQKKGEGSHLTPQVPTGRSGDVTGCCSSSWNSTRNVFCYTQIYRDFFFGKLFPPTFFLFQTSQIDLFLQSLRRWFSAHWHGLPWTWNFWNLPENFKSWQSTH
jgi:hypothetical protein